MDVEHQRDPLLQDLFDSLSYAFPQSRWSPVAEPDPATYMFEQRAERALTSIEVGYSFSGSC